MVGKTPNKPMGVFLLKMISTWGVKWGVPLFSETSIWTHVQFTTQFTTLQCFHGKINNMYYNPKFWMVLLFMMAPYHLKNGTTFLDLFGVFPTSRAAQVSQLARFSTPFRLACSLRTSQTWRSFTPTNQGFRSLMICQAKIVRKQVVTQMGDR